MSAVAQTSRRSRSAMRAIGWLMLAALLAVPALAMRFAPASGFNWTASDFVVGGVLLGGVGLAIETAVRTSRHWSYRGGALVAVGTGFLLLWANLAVGLVGNEDNVLNLLFVAVLVVGAAGSALARLRAAGMAKALALTGIAQLAAAAVALGATQAGPGRPLEITALAGVFPAAWFFSAWLFRRAAGEATCG